MYALKRWMQRAGVGVVAAVVVAGTTHATAPERNMNDAAVRDAVEDELLYDSAVPLNNIDVEVHEGVVTLSGRVNNLLASERATRIARTVKGVRSVVNDTTVTSDRPADAVRSDAGAALLDDPATERFEIAVTASRGGRVTLKGTVDSWQERELAQRVVMGVRGVTAVDNRIDVNYAPDRSDREIATEVRETLRWDALVDHALVRVDVNDGKVVLTGTVGSSAEKSRAATKAWVAGVREVDNSGLEVRKWARDADMRKDKYVVKSDDALKNAIQDALLYDPRVNMFNVTANVDNQVVTLRGNVDNLKAKRAAAADARNTVGVMDVNNRIRVRPDDGLTDEAIATQVRESIERDPYVERYDLNVTVIDNVAHLYGDVDTYFEKSQADEAASRVRGVTRVRNHLVVDYDNDLMTYDPYVDDWYAYDRNWYDYEPRYTMKTDRELRSEINDEMWWSPFVDSDAVQVTVDDGVATLSGSVDSWSELHSAVENAYEGGAVWVDNDLTVQ